MSYATPSGGSPRLTFGQNFGSFERRVATDDAVLAFMRPDPTLDVQLHTHDTAHLILHLSGGYCSSAAGAPSVSRAPAVVYNPPGTTHRDHYARTGRLVTGRFLSIGLSASLWESAADGHRLMRDAVYRCDPRTMVAAACLATALERQPPMPLELDALVLELLSRYAVPTTSSNTSRHAPSWFGRALELLHDRCTEEISIAEIARACDVHPVYLARVFRKQLGQTPGDVLRQARLQRAAALLTTSNWPLSQVAVSCGFVDQSHLTTAFRRSCTMTPGSYRALFQSRD
ncbi:MAG: AraC family transcriptional regulator [Gemmatimonadaceae bacterium]